MIMHTFKDKWAFFHTFLKNRKQIASIIPTSRRATAHICDAFDFSRPVVMVEYGPGVGNIAEEIARRMSPTSRLVLIEMNDFFVAHLKEKFAHDERVEIIHANAQEAKEVLEKKQVEAVDGIVASIPFSFLSDEARKSITKEAYDMLKPQGVFLIFNFTGDMRTYLRDVFGKGEEKRVWRNIPPLRVFIVKKEEKE